jgi:hypothetical protein
VTNLSSFSSRLTSAALELFFFLVVPTRAI